MDVSKQREKCMDHSVVSSLAGLPIYGGTPGGVSRRSYGAFPLHGTARYGTVRFTFGGFSTGYCTWYLILF